MTAPVDVLAVMDTAAATLGWDGSEVKANGDKEGAEVYFKKADALREARAAVAELIEADKEYDAAREAWHLARRPGRQYTAAHRRFIKSGERRAAALARIGGAE